MKTKQLANTLIKILGLSVVVHGIPSPISGLLTSSQFRGGTGQSGFYLLYWVTYLILPVLGVFLVAQSRKVAEYLFKDEVD